MLEGWNTENRAADTASAEPKKDGLPPVEKASGSEPGADHPRARGNSDPSGLGIAPNVVEDRGGVLTAGAISVQPNIDPSQKSS